MQEFYKQLKTFGRVRLNEPLAKHTTFKIGGPADFFIEVKETKKLVQLLNFLSEEGIEYYILGVGSNLLFSDERYEGVVIKVQSSAFGLMLGARRQAFEESSDVIIADAGVLLSQIVNLAAQNSLSGMERGVGIPGTVGGAARGNAGAFGWEISQSVAEVEVWRDGEIIILKNNECDFGYRGSIFKRNSDVILRVWLKLIAGDKKKIMRETQDYLKQRTGKYPNFPSAGSFFKNVKLDGWPGKIADLPELFRQRGSVPAGWLVEQVNMKGYAAGGAKISEEHGNFIINFKNAVQADVLKIVEDLKEKVYNKFGVEIEVEVEIVR